MYKLICFAALIAFANAGIVKVADCGNHEILEVRVNQCEGQVCKIKKGSDLTIEVDFKSNQDTKKAEIELYAKLGDVDIQIPGVDTDACKMNLPCPLKKDTKYTLKYSVFIPKLVPNMVTVVTAKMMGDAGLMGCGKINGEISD